MYIQETHLLQERCTIFNMYLYFAYTLHRTLEYEATVSQ